MTAAGHRWVVLGVVKTIDQTVKCLSGRHLAEESAGNFSPVAAVPNSATTAEAQEIYKVAKHTKLELLDDISTVRQRLGPFVGPQRNLDSFGRPGPMFQGTYSDAGFRVRRYFRRKRTFRPTIDGTFCEHVEGTVVEMVSEPPFLVRVSAVVFSIFAVMNILPLLLLALHQVTSGEIGSSSIMPLVPPDFPWLVVPVFPWLVLPVFCYFVYRIEARRAVRELAEILRPQGA